MSTQAVNAWLLFTLITRHHAKHMLNYENLISAQIMHIYEIRMKSLDPLRAKKIFIRKAEDGPYLGLSYESLISDPIRSGKRNRKYCTLANLTRQSSQRLI